MTRLRFSLSARLSTALLGLLLPAGLGWTQTSTPGTVWRYELLPESQLTDACPICGRPDILLPLRGTFDLRLVEENPIVSRFAVESVAFRAGWEGGPQYKVTGGGSYEIGGEVALQQRWELNLVVEGGAGASGCVFTNVFPQLTRRWPMLYATMDQTNATPLQAFRLDLSAAPFHEIWFSTRHSFTPGTGELSFQRVSGGDLVASPGRVIRHNQDLTRQLGFMPPVPDLGLKDAELLPGGEVAFTIEQDLFSERLGPITQGDVVTDRGRILVRQRELLEAFKPQPFPTGAGVSALQVTDEGEVFFSVQTNFFSESLGRWIHRGDLLSNQGTVVRDLARLLERFGPEDPAKTIGLQSVYVWPSGEVWFSTEEGFVSTNKAMYGRGQLLSDEGYVVYFNLDLLAPFQPLEDLADFGLDALFVVTDVTPAPPAPRCVEARVNPGTSDWTMRFESKGRVSRLERTSQLPEIWEPLGGIAPDLEFRDPGVVEKQAEAYYRLRAW